MYGISQKLLLASVLVSGIMYGAGKGPVPRGVNIPMIHAAVACWGGQNQPKSEMDSIRAVYRGLRGEHSTIPFDSVEASQARRASLAVKWATGKLRKPEDIEAHIQSRHLIGSAADDVRMASSPYYPFVQFQMTGFSESDTSPCFIWSPQFTAATNENIKPTSSPLSSPSLEQDIDSPVIDSPRWRERRISDDMANILKREIAYDKRMVEEACQKKADRQRAASSISTTSSNPSSSSSSSLALHSFSEVGSSSSVVQNRVIYTVKRRLPAARATATSSSSTSSSSSSSSSSIS